MQAAGLTHGGFYRHFASKDALVSEAEAAAFDERTRVLSPDGRPPDAAALRDYIEMYLSNGHLEHPETGCPMPKLFDQNGLGLHFSQQKCRKRPRFRRVFRQRSGDIQHG